MLVLLNLLNGCRTNNAIKLRDALLIVSRNFASLRMFETWSLPMHDLATLRKLNTPATSIEDLQRALGAVAEDAKATYDALGRGQVPVVSVGMWRRLHTALKLAGIE